MRRSEAKYMPRQPARAVLIARRKFADDKFSICGFRARWDYGARWASEIVERVGCQNRAARTNNTKCAIQIGEGRSCAKCCILRKTAKNAVFDVFQSKGVVFHDLVVAW